MRRYLVLAGVFGLAAALSGFAAPAALAKNLVFWTNAVSNTITYANADGSGGFGTLDTSPVTPDLPEGVAMDPANGNIYWANGAGSIMFANLDGGGGGVLNTAGANVDWPFGVALDLARGRIYWSNPTATTPGAGISWANLDGSGGGNLNTGNATVDGPTGVTIDPAAGKIYWSNWNDNVISFAPLDGSGGGDLTVSGATVDHPEGGAIDPATGRFFFADQKGPAISFADVTGTGGGDLATGQATLSSPSGAAIDPFAGKVYWANQNGGEVSSANLDGSGGSDLDTSGSSSTNASLPALLEAPRGNGVPSVSGGSTTPSVLSCSQGSWASDLTAQQLYQAPHSFAYAWTEDGTPISGATTSSISAERSGTYACTVTARNRAGSTAQTSAGFVVSSSSTTGSDPSGPASGSDPSSPGSGSDPSSAVPGPAPAPAASASAPAPAASASAPAPPVATVSVVSTGPTASLRFTCKGAAGQTCAGAFTATGREHTLSGAAVAVTAGGPTAGATKAGRQRTVVVALGRGTYTVAAGHRATVKFTLNAAGKRLLARLHRVAITITFSPTSGTAIRARGLTFKVRRP